MGKVGEEGDGEAADDEAETGRLLSVEGNGGVPGASGATDEERLRPLSL